MDLETIVGFSRADRGRGEKAWGRITGFRGADETHAWVLQQFNAIGLGDATTQTYGATPPIWRPKSWSVELVANAAAGSGARGVILESAFPTSGSRLANGPIAAPIIFVGATTVNADAIRS
jgi:hypothetical protein